jgi:hypothetical protein
MDDDIVPRPDFVQRHLEAQQLNGIVLGYSKPVIPARPSWWQLDAYRWWEDRFREMRQPGHRFSYKDFFSGNVSMPAALFAAVGGFDATITGRLEDYELGVRLIKAGVHFSYAPEALGYHYDQTSLTVWARRYRQEGVADIQIGQRHPELRLELAVATKPRHARLQRMQKLAFYHPRLGDVVEQWLFHQAGLFERLGFRDRWYKVIRLLREYNYWRGVAAVIGPGQLSGWLQEAPLYPTLAANAPTLDLNNLPDPKTLPVVLQRASEAGLRLTLNGLDLLTIPPKPGAEPLRPVHLEAALRELAGQNFVPALALPLFESKRRGGYLWPLNL